MVYRRNELDEIDEALRAVRSEGFEHERCQRRQVVEREQLARLSGQIERLVAERDSEAADVTRLASGGVRAFFIELFGSLDDRLAREQDELRAAEARLASARSAHALVEARLDELTARERATAGATSRLAELLRRREAVLVARHPEVATRLETIAREDEKLSRSVQLLESAGRALDRAAAVLAELRERLGQLASWLNSDESDATMLYRPGRSGVVERVRGLAPRVNLAFFEAREALGAAGLVVGAPASLTLNVDELDDHFVTVIFDHWTSGGAARAALARSDEVQRWLDECQRQLVVRLEATRKQVDAWRRERRELIERTGA